MYALVVVGLVMAIWVTVMLWMERQYEKKHTNVIDGLESASSDGMDHERVRSIKGVDNKV